MTLSYTQGSTLTPLLEKTIGEAFEDTVQRYGSCLALVDRHQRLRFTWAELGQSRRSGWYLGTKLYRVVHRPIRHGKNRRYSRYDKSRLSPRGSAICT